MTNYRAGRDFEYVTRNQLIADGYWVTRSAGSKTKVDLIGVKPGQVLFVQCKRDGRISPAERQALLDLAACLPRVAVPVVAYRLGRSLAFSYLTGPGPKDRQPFPTDALGELA